MATVVNYERTDVWEVRKEAIWIVSNVFTSGDHIQVQDLVDLHGIDVLCEVLILKETSFQNVALDAIETLVRVGDAQGKDYRMLLDQSLEAVRRLSVGGNPPLEQVVQSRLLAIFMGRSPAVQSHA